MDIEHFMNLQFNMLKYAQIEIEKQAYLDSMFILQKIKKDIESLGNHKDFRIAILKIKIARKIEFLLLNALSMSPK